MKVRCERDGTVFNTEPQPYPLSGFQTKRNDKNGDKVIDCPTCGRGYFSDGNGNYVGDRKLTILEI